MSDYRFFFFRKWGKLSNNLFLNTLSAVHVKKYSTFCNKIKIADQSKNLTLWNVNNLYVCCKTHTMYLFKRE